jgi:hypothetical protein
LAVFDIGACSDDLHRGPAAGAQLVHAGGVAGLVDLSLDSSPEGVQPPFVHLALEDTLLHPIEERPQALRQAGAAPVFADIIRDDEVEAAQNVTSG